MVLYEGNYFDYMLGIAQGASSGNEPSFLQMFRETYKKGDFLTTT